MESHLLRSFATIARHGHLGKAAAELKLSKPAISIHLKDLEKTFEHVLFERSVHGMRLTPAGRHLLSVTQKALAALDDVAIAAQRIGNRVSGHADVATVGDAVWLRAPQVLDILHRQHPDLSVRLHQSMSGDTQRGILDGRLAAGWILGPVANTALTSRFLTNARIRVIGPRAWAPRLAIASVQELAEFPWVDTPTSCALAHLRTVLFDGIGKQPVARFQADSEGALYGIVAEGLALSLVREDVAFTGHRNGDLALWPGTVPDLPLQFVIPTIRVNEPIGKALCEAAQRSWGLNQPVQMARASRH